MTSSLCTTSGQTPTGDAPVQCPDSAPFERLADQFQYRQQLLDLLSQTVRLVRGVQRHRGMSLAVLGGNRRFGAELGQLQQALERRLLTLEASAHAMAQPPPIDCHKLHSAWLSLSRNWHRDTVIDNYELHCHLVEQLLAALIELSRPLEAPLSDHPRNPVTPVQRLELAHFCFRLMPSVVEQIGRIRALASYAAARGQCDRHHRGKLHYVMRSTRVNNEKLRHQTPRLQQALGGDFARLGELKRYELMLMFLLNMVESDILEPSDITADSNRLFRVATEIIDVYLGVITRGAELLGRWLDDEREHWLDPEP